ncbi:MAG TPA: TIM44-like domain-containing protein [Magnetospirillum sp.]|jgi:predicted lipid-binding transport protein (Tim44 family)|nr:TIM44-like domain-containing protein [Magnetospirillum sp.]
MRHKILAIALTLLVALSMGADAWAKAGKGSSLGSRGSRTYDRPIERSITPPPATSAPQRPGVEQAPLSQPQQPMYNPGAVRQPTPMAPQPQAQPGFFQRNPMMAGMLGGLVGAGIGSMLFGHSPALAAASSAAPGASFLGLVLQLALIGGLAWLAFRFFRRRSQPQADSYRAEPQRYDEPVTTYHRTIESVPAAGGFDRPQLRRVEKEFELSPADQEAFTQVILGVQKAWSEGNPVALRQFATPEVVGWMGEDLSRDQSKGVRNVVEDVQLLKGDVTESWRDAQLEYATAVISFSAKDYMVRLDNGQVVEGDSQHPVETTEAWTFARSPGGRWLLSAIEQV